MTAPANERNAAIAAFWRWWPEARARIEQAIASGEWGDLPTEIAAYVNAIDSHLDWELSTGTDAEHAFTVSPAGNPSLRVLTERWRAAAPEADATWEFRSARHPRGPEGRLRYGGTEVDLADTRLALSTDDARERIDVRMYHPAFAALGEKRAGLAFLLLDWTLGEDGVERWIGSIEVLEAPDEDTRTLAELFREVRDLGDRATREKFAILQGTDPKGRPIFVTLNQALKRIDHLERDHHLEVELDVMAPDMNGLPSREESHALSELENALQAHLGADGVFAGRVTHGGKRYLHFFIADAAAVEARARAWAASQQPRPVTVRNRPDPQWDVLRDNLLTPALMQGE